METTRLRKTLPQRLTPASAEAEMKHFAEATAELKRLQAELELAIANLRGSYADKIAHYKAQQQKVAERLQRYAQDNYGSLFAKGKSHDLRHGSIGFRQGNPQVLKSRSTTWAQLLQRFKELHLPFVRIKEEPDKQAIVAARTDKALMQQLSKLGVSVVQQETFYCQSNEEHIADD